MSAAIYLGQWVRLESRRPESRPRRSRTRVTVPRQPTWTDGRWQRFFLGSRPSVPGTASAARGALQAGGPAPA